MGVVAALPAFRLIVPARHGGPVVGFATARDKVLPDRRAVLSGKVPADELPVLEHVDHAFAGFHAEGGAARRAHDRERLSARRLHDLLLLALVDAARVLVELDKVLNVVRREGEDKAVLAGVDDGCRFSGIFLGADKVLDVLRDDDLHTVVLADALRQLEHEVERDGVLGVDKNVGLVNDHHDFALETVLCVVVPVLDDLVVDVFEHQQHLGVGDGLVAVGEHRLKIEHGKVGIRRDRRGAVPDVRVSSAGGKLRHIVHQIADHIPGKGVVRFLELQQDLIVQVVKGWVILRSKQTQVGVRPNVTV